MTLFGTSNFPPITELVVTGREWGTTEKNDTVSLYSSGCGVDNFPLATDQIFSTSDDGIVSSLIRYDLPPLTILAFPQEWEHITENNSVMLFETEEEDVPMSIVTDSSEAETTTTTTNNNTSIFVQQWRTMKSNTNQNNDNDNFDQLMEDDSMFPTGQPLDIIDHEGTLPHFLNVDTTDYTPYDSSSSSLSSLSSHDDESPTPTMILSLDEKYKKAAEKLNAAMNRSQQTRNCLRMKTTATENYERKASVKEILFSVDLSTDQVRENIINSSIQQQQQQQQQRR